MNKNTKDIIMVAGGIIVWTVLCSTVSYVYWMKKTNTINWKISQYIEHNCAEIEKCRINLANFTDFEWDHMCIFWGEISDSMKLQLPTPLPDALGLNSDKTVYIKNKNLARFEDIPLGIEYTPNHTVEFDDKDFCIPNSGFEFKVEARDGGDGIYYILKGPECVNERCPEIRRLQ